MRALEDHDHHHQDIRHAEDGHRALRTPWKRKGFLAPHNLPGIEFGGGSDEGPFEGKQRVKIRINDWLKLLLEGRIPSVEDFLKTPPIEWLKNPGFGLGGGNDDFWIELVYGEGPNGENMGVLGGWVKF